MHTLKRCMAAMVALLALSLAMTARAELPDFTPLVEQASPAVVNISTRQKLPDRAMARGQLSIPDLEGLPPMFRDFLERSIPQVPRNPRGQQREAQSLGSGFIISNDGYILTNNHVVADADEILVRLSDRSEHKAKLVGADPRSDVAVLKIEAKNLPTLKLGDSNKLKVGEWVLAIGSPFGFDHSVTAGIVSAKGRSLPNESYVPFIQTDVAINPGNSGGPLLNLQGEVVGINSQIFTRSGGFMGLSFAIPIDVALNVADQLKKAGKVSRGWLGVVIQEVNKDLAESFGLDKPSGALVAQLVEDGPAAKGGLQVGDVILSLNGRRAQQQPPGRDRRRPDRRAAQEPGYPGRRGDQGSPGRSGRGHRPASGRCHHPPGQQGGDLDQGLRRRGQGPAEEPFGFDAGAAPGTRQLHYLQAGRISRLAKKGRFPPPFFMPVNPLPA